jgi:hypothetical protein
MTTGESSYRGSCHCGAVTFSVAAPITRAMRCTCSICSRVGALWHGTSDSALEILSGQSELALYQFGTRTAKHYFCRHCGVRPFTRPRLNPAMWAVNLRCVPEIDAESLPTSVFDGANWEEAARAFLASRKTRGAGSSPA